VADTSYISSVGAKDQAVLVQTQLANCTMHLFKQGFVPGPTTPLSAFQANECDFDGYTPATIATWGDPVLAGNAWAIFAPTQTFRWTLDTGVVNTVAGYWLQLSGGDLKDYTIFNPAESVSGPGQAIIRTPVEVFPFG
jgi:hypothetical protein